MEIIGFIVSILSLIYLFFKQQSLIRQDEEQPNKPNKQVERGIELHEREPSKELKRIRENKIVGREGMQKSSPPPFVNHPKPLTLSSFRDYDLADQIEKQNVKNTVEKRQLKIASKQRLEEKHTRAVMLPSLHSIGEKDNQGPSKVMIALQRLSNRRDLLIYQEIIDKPKSMRPY